MYITWEIILIQVLTPLPCLIPELKGNCIAQRIIDMNPELFSVFLHAPLSRISKIMDLK